MLFRSVGADLEEVGERDEIFAGRETRAALPSRHGRLVASEPFGDVVLGEASARPQLAEPGGQVVGQGPRDLFFWLFAQVRWGGGPALRTTLTGRPG